MLTRALAQNIKNNELPWHLGQGVRNQILTRALAQNIKNNELPWPLGQGERN
jgi:hypothetical protein